MRFAIITTAVFMATTAQADGINVQFIEGAPKDSFRFINGGCAIENATITVDLRTTPAGLIFDVTGAGAGVEVFQPVDITSGSVVVSPVSDGDQTLEFTVANFPAGTTISLTTDLDDTVSGRQITVNDSEMSGAMITIATDATSVTAPFDGDSEAVLLLGQDCPAS